MASAFAVNSDAQLPATIARGLRRRSSAAGEDDCADDDAAGGWDNEDDGAAPGRGLIEQWASSAHSVDCRRAVACASARAGRRWAAAVRRR